jgi:hypothetical protein
MDLIRKTLADEIIPDFCSKVGSRFQEQLPELEKNAIMAGQHLGEFAKQYMEKRLSAALERGIKSSNSEIQTIFPNLDERALMKSLDEGKEAFIEQLHEVLEERYAMVASHLDGLKATAEAVAKSKGHEELVAMIHQAPARGKGEPAVDPAAAVKDRLVDPEVLGEIEARLVETLLELAIYELDPKKGDLLVK